MKERIIKLLLDVNPYIDINEQTNLLEEELLDSMAILVLIDGLESEFGCSIAIEDVATKDFETIESIKNLVIRMKK